MTDEVVRKKLIEVALPLEAQRLGLEAYASDLINKAMIEIPPRCADRPPINPEERTTLRGTPASSISPGVPASSRPLPQHLQKNEEWHSRGYLPHRDAPGLVQSITFRLADSLPQTVLGRLTEELASLPEERRQNEREQRIRDWLDQGHGACYLAEERIATMVEGALLHFDGERYHLLAWCVMPNHVHVLIETMPEHPLAQVVHSWKSFMANQANKNLNHSGEFWQREYYDRYMRDARHLEQTIEYIEQNPVKAELVKNAMDWRYSSAQRKKGGT